MVVNLIALPVWPDLNYDRVQHKNLSKNNLGVSHFLYLIQYNDKLNLDWFLLVI